MTISISRIEETLSTGARDGSDVQRGDMAKVPSSTCKRLRKLSMIEDRILL